MRRKPLIMLFVAAMILAVVACFSIVGMLPRWISLAALTLMVGGCVVGILVHMRQSLPRQLFVRAVVAMVAMGLFALLVAARDVTQNQYPTTGLMVAAALRELLQWVFCGSYLVWIIFTLLHKRIQRRAERDNQPNEGDK